MKLRLDKNSLRLRVKKSDLEKLKTDGVIEEVISFPKENFYYHLRISSDEKEIVTILHPHSVEVIIPGDIAQPWMNNDEVGIYRTVAIDEKKTLDIIIEKDFPCKDRPHEDEGDTFTELAEKHKKDEC